jgi:hypothetical protein
MFNSLSSSRDGSHRKAIPLESGFKQFDLFNERPAHEKSSRAARFSKAFPYGASWPHRQAWKAGSGEYEAVISGIK